MREYEIIHEIFNGCGGVKHRDMYIEETVCENPQEYVRSLHGDSPDSFEVDGGENSIAIRVVTGEITHMYTFTEV